MVFDFFKKKKEVVDLSSANSSGIPASGYLKRKTISTTQGQESIRSNNSLLSPNQNSNQNSGGFFSFFGSSDNSNSSSPVSSPAQTSAYGSSYNSNPSSESLETIEKLKSQIEDISYKLSRMIDRLELLEKKMDRLERRDSNI